MIIVLKTEKYSIIILYSCSKLEKYVNILTSNTNSDRFISI